MGTKGSEIQWRVRSSKDLGRAISGVRKKKGLTQEALAEETQIERRYLSRMENGATASAVDRALKLLRRMGAEVTVSFKEPDGS